MVGAVERIKRREEICSEYVRGYSPNDDSDEIVGRVELEIIDFTSYESDYDNPRWRVYTETEWGEIATWSYNLSTFHSTWVATLCEECDIPYSQFEDLVGESFWTDVKEVEWSDGEANS